MKIKGEMNRMYVTLVELVVGCFSMPNNCLSKCATKCVLSVNNNNNWRHGTAYLFSFLFPFSLSLSLIL